MNTFPTGQNMDNCIVIFNKISKSKHIKITSFGPDLPSEVFLLLHRGESVHAVSVQVNKVRSSVNEALRRACGIASHEQFECVMCATCI